VARWGRRYPLELKIRGARGIGERPGQPSGHMERRWTHGGWLVVLDKDFGKPWDVRLSWETMGHGGRTILVVGGHRTCAVREGVASRAEPWARRACPGGSNGLASRPFMERRPATPWPKWPRASVD
jgi:hypothetical protein